MSAYEGANRIEVQHGNLRTDDATLVQSLAAFRDGGGLQVDLAPNLLIGQARTALEESHYLCVGVVERHWLASIEELGAHSAEAGDLAPPGASRTAG